MWKGATYFKRVKWMKIFVNQMEIINENLLEFKINGKEYIDLIRKEESRYKLVVARHGILSIVVYEKKYFFYAACLTPSMNTSLLKTIGMMFELWIRCHRFCAVFTNWNAIGSIVAALQHPFVLYVLNLTEAKTDSMTLLTFIR